MVVGVNEGLRVIPPLLLSFNKNSVRNVQSKPAFQISPVDDVILVVGVKEGLRVILPLLLSFNKKLCPQCSVKTCSQGQLGHGPIYLCIVTAVRGREEIDREIKMTTSGVKPKMGIGRFYISVTMGNVKKVLLQLERRPL